MLSDTSLFRFTVITMMYCFQVFVVGMHLEMNEKRHQVCRDRNDYFQPKDFRVSTCTMCLLYLFPTNKIFKQVVLNGTATLVKLVHSDFNVRAASKTSSPKQPKKRYTYNESTVRLSSNVIRPTSTSNTGLRILMMQPDVRNETSLQEVLKELTTSQKERWLQCCNAASKCCDRQLKRAKRIPLPVPGRYWSTRNGTSHVETQCPMTWDGYSCVADTDAGTTAQVTCPSFISLYSIDPQARASRKCLSNATWWVSSESRMEWTDYSKCVSVDVQTLKIELIIIIVCNAVSIIFLVPSIVVLAGVRALRSQQRVRLHICLFVTLLLSSVTAILWERLVMYEMLVRPLLQNLVYKSPTGCKFLNILTRLSKTSTFFWMFCEGFQLHWLMVKTFKPIKTMLMYFLIGWGIPTLLIVTYVLVRSFHFENDLCWLVASSGLEWLIDGPTIACIVLNAAFLVTILRALLSQLNAHPEEVGSLRRAMRAMLILIPLLGIQQFCIIYRPHVSQDGYFVYAIVSALIVNLQGAAVALIFCFFNSEVQTQSKELFQRLRIKFVSGQPRRQSAVSMTLQTFTHRRSLASLDIDITRNNTNGLRSLQLDVLNEETHSAGQSSQSHNCLEENLSQLQNHFLNHEHSSPLCIEDDAHNLANIKSRPLNMIENSENFDIDETQTLNSIEQQNCYEHNNVENSSPELCGQDFQVPSSDLRNLDSKLYTSGNNSVYNGGQIATLFSNEDQYQHGIYQSSNADDLDLQSRCGNERYVQTADFENSSTSTCLHDDRRVLNKLQTKEYHALVLKVGDNKHTESVAGKVEGNSEKSHSDCDNLGFVGDAENEV